MFDSPLKIPSGTEYDELCVGPEADESELRDAQRELIEDLATRRRESEQRLQAITDRVPGLAEAVARVKALLSSDSPDPVELRTAKQALAKHESAALRIDGSYRDLRSQIDDFSKRELAVNRLQVLRADERAAYDDRHPPLGLLRFENGTDDAFATDQELMLWHIRSELSQFLSERGDKVFHPSDLTRDDFTADFTYNKLLDG